MAELSHRYALPFIAAGQAQKEVTHNEAVERIDALLHLSVLSMSLDVPPVGPVVGSAWIVGSAPTGEWAGHAADIASYGGGGWRFVQPVSGCLAWVADLGVFAVRTDAGWLSDAWPVRALRIGGSVMLAAAASAIPDTSGGATVDAEARAAILSILNVLRYMGLIAG